MRFVALLALSSIGITVASTKNASATARLWTSGSQWAASAAPFDTEDFETTQNAPQFCTDWMEPFPIGNSCAHEHVIHAAKLDFVIGIGWHPQDPFVDDSGLVNGSREIRGDLHSSTNLVSFGPRYNRIVFPTPVTAFGAELAHFEAAAAHPAALEVLGQLFLIANGASFIGITSDEPFSEITLRAEEVQYMTMWYYLDDVSFVPVPEPSAAVLVALGLVALAANRHAGRMVRPADHRTRTWPPFDGCDSL